VPVEDADGQFADLQLGQAGEELAVKAVAVGLHRDRRQIAQARTPGLGEQVHAAVAGELPAGGAVTQRELEGAFGGCLAAGIAFHGPNTSVVVANQRPCPVAGAGLVDANGTGGAQYR
jgi:hypothetical protein